MWKFGPFLVFSFLRGGGGRGGEREGGPKAPLFSNIICTMSMPGASK